MKKLYLGLLIAVVCNGAQAQRDNLSQRDYRSERDYLTQRDYPSQRDARNNRSFDACVDDYTRGAKTSRKQMRNIEEQCRRTSARQLQPRESRQRGRNLSPTPSMPDGPTGRNLRGVPDTSGPP